MTCSVILVAAGRSTRIGGPTPKPFLPVAGKPLFTHALRTIARLPSIRSLILVVNADWRSTAERILADQNDLALSIELAIGGRERQDSVAAGLRVVQHAELVAVHDSARPFASATLFTHCIEAAAECGAAIAALPAKDTAKRGTPDRLIRDTIDRSTIWLAQTPQVFRTSLLKRAYEEARSAGFLGTDDAALVERLGASVRLVLGEESNRKITTPDDLEWAEWYAKRQVARG